MTQSKTISRNRNGNGRNLSIFSNSIEKYNIHSYESLSNAIIRVCEGTFHTRIQRRFVIL